LTMRVSMGVRPSTVRRNLSCGCARRGPPSRRTSPGPAPCTARNARPNASVEPYPCRTAMLSRSSRPLTTSAAATVMRRRRTYSERGMPANDENIRRRWYSVVASVPAHPLMSISPLRCSSTRSTSWLSAEITRPPFDINSGRQHLVRARPLRSDPIIRSAAWTVAALTHAHAAITVLAKSRIVTASSQRQAGAFTSVAVLKQEQSCRSVHVLACLCSRGEVPGLA
jgi:hypothetical protein